MKNFTNDIAYPEIERRSVRGEQLMRDIPDGIRTFEEFFQHPLLDGLDFITVNEAWKKYQSRGYTHSEGTSRDA